jgi:hypothetical protein
VVELLWSYDHMPGDLRMQREGKWKCCRWRCMGVMQRQGQRRTGSASQAGVGAEKKNDTEGKYIPCCSV